MFYGNDSKAFVDDEFAQEGNLLQDVGFMQTVGRLIQNKGIVNFFLVQLALGKGIQSLPDG